MCGSSTAGPDSRSQAIAGLQDAADIGVLEEIKRARRVSCCARADSRMRQVWPAFRRISDDASVHHVKNGTAGPALVLTLFSTSACQTATSVAPPTAFSQTGCTPSTVGGKQYATYHLGWTAGSNPSVAIYQIGSASSNNSGSAAIIRTGRIIQTADDVGPYLVTSTASPRYFWVRHVNGGQASSWAALQGNPIQINDGCLL
jgi:hypothetical protein